MQSVFEVAGSLSLWGRCQVFFSGRDYVGEIGNIVFLISNTIFFNSLKKSKKWKLILNYRSKYKINVTQERVHTYNFDFHNTTHLKIDIFKMRAKLGTLPIFTRFYNAVYYWRVNKG